ERRSFTGTSLRTSQHEAGRESFGISRAPRDPLSPHARTRPHLLYRIRHRNHRPSRRRKGDSRGGGGGVRSGKTAPVRALRQRNRRRRHEYHLLYGGGKHEEQTAADAERMFRRHSHMPRKDRNQSATLA